MAEAALRTVTDPRPTWAIWRPRLVGTALVTLGCILLTALLPLLVPLALIVSLVRRDRFAALRFVGLVWLYLAVEVFGVYGSGVLWLVGGWHGLFRERYADWNFGIRFLWARALFYGTCLIYGIRVEVEEPAQMPEGPCVLFMRHASLGDTLIPAIFVEHRHGLRLRYVMKRELLRDPAINVGGHRLPSYFVDRDAAQSGPEIDAIRLLGRGLGPREGIVMFPEGTRFTEARRERVIEKLVAAGEEDMAARAARLVRTLPPRIGGPLAVLESRPAVILCSHVGFEGAAKFQHVFAGSLIGTVIRIRLQPFLRDEVPTDREELIEWLFERWQEVDRWVCENESRGASAPQDIEPIRSST